MKDIMIDTDPGMGWPWADIDDNLAILLALGQPDLRIKLISVVGGNVPLDEGVSSVSKTLALSHSEVPVSAGCQFPLVRALCPGRKILGEMAKGRGLHLSYAGEFAGPVQKVSVPRAFPMQVKALEQAESKVTIVCLGPLTNVAYLVHQRPDLLSRIDQLVVMGGALQVSGNVTPFAEFNFWVDPEAARIVFDAEIRKVLVPLDITSTIDITMEDIRENVNAKSELGRSIIDSSEGWIEALGALTGKRSFNPHDPVAMSYLVDPALFDTERADVTIDERTGKATEGRNMLGSTLVCRHVQESGFRSLFFRMLREV